MMQCGHHSRRGYRTDNGLFHNLLILGSASAFWIMFIRSNFNSYF